MMVEFNGVPVKPGDTITLEHDDGTRLAPAAVRTPSPPILPAIHVVPPHLGTIGWSIASLPEGWRIAAHEPKVELPTEPGLYLSGDAVAAASSGVLRLYDDGRWQWIGNRYASFLEVLQPREAEAHLPLTRLRPEKEVAAEVIEWLEESDNLGPWSLKAAWQKFVGS